MVTIFNNLNLSQLQNLNERNLSSVLKVGQQLNVNIDKISGNQVLIKLGSLSLNATTLDTALKTGPAKVEVTQTQPQLMVSLVKTTNTPSNASASNQKIVETLLLQTALRQLLPNQASLNQTFQQLSLLPNLPPNLQAPLQQLLDQMKKTNLPNGGKALKAEVENSGLFFESKVKNIPAGKNAQTLQQDLKALMLQLLKTAQSTEPQNANIKQLTKALIQAINRISYQQLSYFETPMNLQMEFIRERGQTTIEEQLHFKKNQRANQSSWQVWLQIGLPEGILQTKISLNELSAPIENDGMKSKPKHQLFCYFWCENSEILDQIKQSEEILVEKLSELELDTISVQLSQEPLEFNPDKHKQPISLIDVKI